MTPVGSVLEPSDLIDNAMPDLEQMQVEDGGLVKFKSYTLCGNSMDETQLPLIGPAYLAFDSLKIGQ